MDRVNAKFTTVTIPSLQEIENDGKVDGKCSLTFSTGQIMMDLLVEKWLKRGHNCSLLGYSEVGMIGDGSGFLGSMGAKMADVALVPSKIWSYKIDHIGYSIPIYDEFLHIVCAYNYTESMKSTDLMDSYLEFDALYYISLIFSFAIFIMAWKMCSDIGKCLSDSLKNELNNSRLPSYWIVISAILDQDQFPNISRIAFTMLSLCISSFFFIFLNCFMMTMMRSGFIVITEPAVIRSYQDAIDRTDLRLLFFKGYDEESFFKDATRGTMENAIWKKSFRLEDAGVEAIASIWQPIIDQRMAIILRDWVGRSAINLILSKTRERGIDYIRALDTKDETGKIFTNALMYRKDAPVVLLEYFHEQISLITQSGILEWYLKERVPREFQGGNEITLDLFASSKLFLPEAPEPVIRLNNVTKFRNLYFALISISMIVLTFEIIQFKFMIETDIGIVRVRKFDINQRRRYRKKNGFEFWVMEIRDKIFNPVIVI